MITLVAAICVALASSRRQHADPFASINDAFDETDTLPEGYVHSIGEDLRRELPGELPGISFTPNEEPFKVTILNEEEFKAKRANASRMIDGEDMFHTQVFGGASEGHQRAWYERMIRKGLEAELRRRKKAGEPEFDIEEAIKLNREEQQQQQQQQQHDQAQDEQEEAQEKNEQEEAEEASLLQLHESRRSRRKRTLRKSSHWKRTRDGPKRCGRFTSCTACTEASNHLQCADEAWGKDFKSDNKLNNGQKLPCRYTSYTGMSSYYVKGTTHMHAHTLSSQQTHLAFVSAGCKWDSKNYKCTDITCKPKDKDCVDATNAEQNPMFVVDKKHCIVTSKMAKSSGTGKSDSETKKSDSEAKKSDSEPKKSDSETTNDSGKKDQTQTDIDTERLINEFKCEYTCEKSGVFGGEPCGVTVDLTDTPGRETCALAGCGSSVCKEQAIAECAAHVEKHCSAKATCVKDRCDKAISVQSGATPGVLRKSATLRFCSATIQHPILPCVCACVALFHYRKGNQQLEANWHGGPQITDSKFVHQQGTGAQS